MTQQAKQSMIRRANSLITKLADHGIKAELQGETPQGFPQINVVDTEFTIVMDCYFTVRSHKIGTSTLLDYKKDNEVKVAVGIIKGEIN